MGKIRVLCIDDDADILDILRMILESNDFEMEEASSAEEGLKKAKEVKPDIILCDLMMEEVDAGMNFVKEMKVLGDDVPIFILSSVGDNLNMAMDYTQMGLAGVLQKPIDPDKLVKILRSKLDE